MIAKYITILAIIARINASGCGCGHSSLVSPNISSTQRSPNFFVSSDNNPCDCSSSGNGITRNLVIRRKYPVALSNCGPTLNRRIPVITSRVTTPLREKPTVRLPASIPAPKTICHSCTCYKTIVRPRVHHQIITVPSVERFLETFHKPVVESMQYEALPVNCGGRRVQLMQVGAGTSKSGLLELVSVGPQIQTVEIPLTQTIQVPRTAVLEAQCGQSFQTPQIQTVSLGSCSCQC